MARRASEGQCLSWACGHEDLRLKAVAGGAAWERRGGENLGVSSSG